MDAKPDARNWKRLQEPSDFYYCIISGASGRVLLNTPSVLLAALALDPGTWFGRGATQIEAQRAAELCMRGTR